MAREAGHLLQKVAASGLHTHTLPNWPLIFWEFTYQYTPLWQINCIYPYRGVSLGLKELGSSICSDGLPGGSVVKNLFANAGDEGSILGLGRSPGKGNGNPLQYYCQENPKDRGTWWAAYSPWGCKELDTSE